MSGAVAAPRVTLAIGIALSLALTTWLLANRYWPTVTGMDIGGTQLGHDFINAWIAPYLATHGQEQALLDVGQYSAAASARMGHALPNCIWSYPPVTLLLYYPFSLPAYFVSLSLWTGFGIAAMLAALRAYCPAAPLAAPAMLLAPATIINLLSGQNGFWTAALLILGMLNIKRHPVLAGVAFGLLTMKPQLGLILPFVLLAMRAWRTIMVAILTLAVLLVLSVLMFGVEIWSDYLTRMVKFEMGFLDHFQGMYAAMMLSPFAGFRRLGLDYSSALLLQTICLIAVIVFAVKGVFRTDDPRRQAFIVASAVPLATPYIFNYDLVALSIPLTCLFLDKRRREWWVWPAVLIAWTAPLLGMFGAVRQAGILQALAPLAFAGIFVIALRERDGHETVLP